MSNLNSPIYRSVATAKALYIAIMLGVAAAAEYLKEHGFTCEEALTILVKGK